MCEKQWCLNEVFAISKLRKGLYVLAGTAVVLLTAVLVIVSVDFGMLKNRIELLVTEKLGREFRIDGELHAYVGTKIELYAENIYLANPDWAKDEAFVSVRKIDVVVNTWSFISGPIDIEHLEINGVRVNIEQNDQGDASWQFSGIKPEDDEPTEPEKSIALLEVVFDQAAVNDIRVSFSSPILEQPLLFVADSLVSSIGDDILRAEITGTLNGTPVHFEKTVGPVENLLRYENVNVDITGNVGEIRLRSTFWIDHVLVPRRPRVQIDIAGPDANYLTDILGVKPVTQGPLELSVSIEESGEQMVASVSGAFGEFDLHLDVRFQDIQELDNIDLEIEADGPDIGKLLRFAGRDYAESDPFTVEGRITRAGPEVTIDNILINIGASELTLDGFFGEYPTLKGGNLSFAASGPDYGRFNRLFGLPGNLDGAFTTSLTIAPHGDGRARINFAAEAPHITANLTSLFKFADNFNSTTVELEISGLDVGKLGAAVGVSGLPNEEFHVNASLEKDSNGILIRSLEALVGDDMFKINGHVGDNPLAGETDINIDFSGTDLGASVVALGGTVERLPKGAFHLQGRVLRQENELELRNVRAVIGDERDYLFQLSGFLTQGQRLAGSKLSIQAQGASIAALAELAGQQGIPDIPFKVAADITRGSSSTGFDNGKFESGAVVVEFSGRVGDSPLTDDMEIDFNASLPDPKKILANLGVSANYLPDGDLIAKGFIRQSSGEIRVRSFEATFAGATLQLNGDIGRLPSLAGTRLEFELDGNNFSRLLPADTQRESLEQRFEASGRITLTADELEMDRFRANIGHTSISGDVVLGLMPLLGRGSFNLKADSRDIYQLFPSLDQDSVPRSAKLKFRGGGSWEDNFWSLGKSRLDLGRGFIEISGSLDGPPSFERTNLEIEVSIQSARNLSVLVGRVLPDHPLLLNARLVGTRDVITLDNFEFTFGDSDLGGRFTLQDGDVPLLNIDVTSQLFDISGYQPEREENPPSEEAVVDHRVIPDTPLPFDLLRSFDADIDLRLSEVRTRAIVIEGLEVDAAVANGAVIIERLAVDGRRGGTLAMTAELISISSGNAEFNVTMDGEGLVLGFRAQTDEELQQLPTFDLHANLTANGGTVRELAGSLDGYIRLVGGAGRVPSGSLSFFTQDFVTEIASAINPFAKSDPYTKVQCAVILMHIDSGVINGKPVFVQQTDKLRIIANANVDLNSEKIVVDFKMTPQKGLGLSISSLVNPYVKLTGTLGKPSLVLDAESVIIEGGVAVATAGLSILAKGLKDRFFSGKDPCGKAIAEADGIQEARGTLP